MILIAGATGTVGGMVSERLAKHTKVRGLVRKSSSQEKTDALAKAGVELTVGDLTDRASLEKACKGITTLISTASTTLSRQPEDNIPDVDNAAQVALVDIAKAAGCQHFVLVSFPVQSADSPIQQAKRAVEKRMIESGRGYTILRPTYFTEVWLGPALGFDFQARKARIFGSGNARHPWIGIEDVVAYTVGAIDNPKARNAVLDLGGPDELSQREVVKLFEQLGGKPFELEEVPEAALVTQYQGAKDPLEKSFAALTLGVAQGVKMDRKPSLAALPLERPSTVRDYARRSLGL